MTQELARTRVDLQRPDAILHGSATAVSREALRARGVRAVGRYRHVGPGQYAVPVVYVSKRAVPWYERRSVYIPCGIVGVLAVLASLAAWAILSLGLATFLAIVVGIPSTVGALSLWVKMRGQGGHSITVNTSTRVRIR